MRCRECKKKHDKLSVRHYCPTCQARIDREEAMTDEELEAIIAEQMEQLPEWWEHSGECADCHVSPFRGGFQPRFTAPVKSTAKGTS